MALAFLDRWRAERLLARRAAAYVRSILQEPSDPDVSWLAAEGTGGDSDHARWELRYARRALGLLVAQRDALDDRTASVVAKALTASVSRDPNIAAGKVEIATRQLNARLRTYGDALGTRGSPEPTAVRLARALLQMAGRRGPPGHETLGRAGEILAAYIADANEALRREFGVASLPEHLPPSAAAGGAERR